MRRKDIKPLSLSSQPNEGIYRQKDSDAKHQEESQFSKELLDFHLEKACTSFFEAGKAMINFYILTLLFFGLTAVFVSGEGTDNIVSVPLIGINLNRWNATEATLFLGCACYFSLNLMQATQRFLSFKVDDLIAQRYGQEGFHWHIYYPSIFQSSELLRYVSKLGVVIDVATVLILVGLVFANVWFGYLIGSNFNWNLQSIIVLAISGGILSISFITLAITPRVTYKREAILARIEGYPVAKL